MICKIKIDGCLITEGERCDFLVIDSYGNRAIFVELKGSDLLKGIGQIEQTINQLQSDITGCSVHARVVLRKVTVPDLRNNPIVLRFKKRIGYYGGDLKIATIKLEEKI